MIAGHLMQQGGKFIYISYLRLDNDHFSF